MNLTPDDPKRVGDEDLGRPYRFKSSEPEPDYFQEVTDRERGRFINMDCVPTPEEILERQDAFAAREQSMISMIKGIKRMVSNTGWDISKTQVKS